MKKRLRKKLRIGEFFEPLLDITASFKEVKSEEELDTFIDILLNELDSLHCLSCGTFNNSGFSIVIQGDCFKHILTRTKWLVVNKVLEDLGVVITHHLYIATEEQYKEWEKNEAR